jgi:hypothetical protein
LAVTAEVDAVNVVEDEPPAMLTFAGTVTAVLFRDTAKVIPPVGAGLDSVTVQLLEDPPATVAGRH